MFGKIFDAVDAFVSYLAVPASTIVTHPLRDGLEVFQELTEGELRVKAATRLGVDVVAGMAAGELVAWAKSEQCSFCGALEVNCYTLVMIEGPDVVVCGSCAGANLIDYVHTYLEADRKCEGEEHF